ncbi:FAD/NAD(P)-binding protein [Methylicorpusculum sp.]|uniref:FAD/NAD(P)-binding protein n=1 Tax=Methylicorpusculum sp. TaxID=2713644 RepID=UPI002736A642|nr:FAD/NAD(P)-binding protein [Methylicorpusculum sp.]MDP3528583.1 FAD/NAD(P)-binding protein [Methylicorpusculum sp.]MDZ4149758.1 FAD/NAD(P)-binding protein [Methylicorpusculum sp.]
MPASSIPIIAIVGGGFSGSLVAAQLLRQSSQPLIIKLIERNPHFLHRGIAYSTHSSSHLLNVPAGNMSAFPDDPGHFLRWVQVHQITLIDPPWVTDTSSNSFISRRGYGQYISWVVEESLKVGNPNAKLDIIQDEVVKINQSKQGATLSLLGSEQIHAQKVILAIGNFPPADPPVSENVSLNKSCYVSNPWSEDSKMSWDDVASCLIVGAGLTMVDWVLSLHDKNFRGKIHVVSRRGLCPKEHDKVTPVQLWLNYKEQQPITIRSILKQFRMLMNTPGPAKDNWRGLIDALRPFSQEIWQALSLSEQRRFLRHVRSFWDNHRHRLPPITAAILSDLEQSGQLIFYRGRVESFDDSNGNVQVIIRSRGQKENITLRVDRVLNCTGGECDYRKLQHPLIKGLFIDGLAQPDAIGFGLSVDSNGALLDGANHKSSIIYTLGPPQKGTLWETTAVPEIRGQAYRLAEELLGAMSIDPANPYQ